MSSCIPNFILCFPIQAIPHGSEQRGGGAGLLEEVTSSPAEECGVLSGNLLAVTAHQDGFELWFFAA